MASGVLESATINTLPDAHPPAHPPLKKRKTWHLTGDRESSPIVIRAPTTSLSSTDHFTLTPLVLLPRSHLPFNWLDTTASPLLPIQPGSLFVADIPTLGHDRRRNQQPTVLVVRLVSDSGLYVVERVKRGVYALSKLGPWVGEGDVFVAGKGASFAPGSGSPGMDEREIGGRPQSPDIVDEDGNAGEWWQAASVEEPVVEMGVGVGLSGKRGFDVCVAFHDHDVRVDDGLPRAADSQDMFAAMERSSSSDAQVQTTHGTQQREATVFGDIEGDQMNSQNDDLQPPQELLDGLREQYLQALYISKTSLAYFAKGPLTRCRTAFQSSEPESPKKAMDLVTFYHEAILSAKKMDLKYRETLPATIHDVMLIISDDEQPKRRKNRKRKLGKNGLYPKEEGFIRKWWKDRSMPENGSTTETSREAEMKKHVADLRLRETQLQILLILEAMALESSINEARKPDDDDNGEKQPAEELTKKSTSKKLQDLNVMLELHLDRLCIWHAVSSDDLAIPESVKDTENNHLSGKKAESDTVRDFCTEVIIPFYASRLPDKCKLITRKFGIPSSITSSTKQSHAKKTPRRESESTKRQRFQPLQQQQQPQKHRRTLQRVLTDEQSAASQARHPSLQRSKTAPSKHDVNNNNNNNNNRHESMEPLLPMAIANVRGGIQKAKRVENREVDLNAQARQHETKLRKVQMLVDQKKELDAAIHALRRPNRELVAKDIVEDAEKRTSTGAGPGGGGGSARKQKHPMRNPMGQGVQVMATPKGSRKRDVSGFELPRPPPVPQFPGAGGAGLRHSSPPDDAPVVPASAIRSSFTGLSNKSVRDTSGVQETPTRRPTRSFESESLLSMNTSQPASNYPSGNLFRVASLSSMKGAAPSTPVSRRVSAPGPSKQLEQVKSSIITETPPKQQAGITSVPSLTTEPTAAAAESTILSTPVKEGMVQTTPVKKSTVERSGAATTAAAHAVPVTPEKSIYEQLGWNDDDELEL